jgi:crotonobetainyl-CoA:carnitine CoA-transferase CaiB-like acyl-CoA transferase
VAVPFTPLAGIKVVDVTTSLAGPYCAELLGALGAAVIKIEPPGGDEARTWGPPWADGKATMFMAMNAGKRSLALDLRRGVEVVGRLAERADVFVQSLRPGLAEERGIGPEVLRPRNPRLVYCSIWAFGSTGPWRSYPGYDPLAQAASGILSVTGEPDRPPVRVGVSLVDQGTGLWAAFAVLAALHERERTGEGRTVDVSLYETALGLVSYQLGGYLATGEVPGRWGSSFSSIAPYRVYETRDGELMIAAGNDRLFAALAEELGVPELAEDPRYATNPERVARRAELDELVAPRLRTEDTATWLERLRRAGVPHAPVHDVGQAADHEQTRALGILQELDGYTTVGPAFSVDGERPEYDSPPPELGAHSAEIMTEAGYSDEEIAALAADGVIRLGSG